MMCVMNNRDQTYLYRKAALNLSNPWTNFVNEPYNIKKAAVLCCESFCTVDFSDVSCVVLGPQVFTGACVRHCPDMKMKLPDQFSNIPPLC